MAKTVFILGAGSSKVTGAPLMDEFIDLADDLRAAPSSKVHKPSLDLVFDLIQKRLPRLHAKTVVSLSNVESVYSLIEMGRLVGRLPGTARSEIADVSRAMRVFLSETVLNADARFGIVASSKDKELVRFGISNDYQTTKRVKMGPWYGDGDGSPLSCRQLTSCVTEFGAQGLELDAVLLAWGADYVINAGKWSNANSSGYLRKKLVRDPFQLRLNAYRVLLTRARDVVVVFVPRLSFLDDTFDYLVACGFMSLKSHAVD